MLYQKLKPHIDKSEYIHRFDQLSASEANLFCSNINHTAKALLLSRLFEKEALRKKNLLFITSDCNKAEEYYEDIALIIGDGNVAFLPDYETLPYEDRSPHYSIRAKRLQTMERALSPQPLILVLSVKSLLRKILCPQVLEKSIMYLEKDKEIDFDYLCSKLISFGYTMENEVTKVGEISRRGGILDVYPPTQSLPIRVEFFGDYITSIRYFKPMTQKSTTEIEDIVKIIPAREVSLDDVSTEIPKQWEKIHSEGLYEGIEQDVSLLYNNTGTIVDYLTTSCGGDCKSIAGIFDEYSVLKNQAQELITGTNELYLRKVKSTGSKKNKQSPAKDESLIPSPQMVFENFEYLVSKIQKKYYFSSLVQSADVITDHKTEDQNHNPANGIKEDPPLQKSSPPVHHLPGAFTPQTAINRDISLLQDIIEERLKNNWQIFMLFDNKSQSKRMREALGEYTDKINFELGVLHRGFDLPDAKLALYTDHEIFNRYKQKKYQEYFPASEALVDYESLRPGDYIVHIDHGIGLYEGLKLMNVGGSNIECLSIRYAGDSRVYVPTFQLRLVTRYVAEDGVVPELHKLGGKRWQQAKDRAKKHIEMIADDLVKLYAERTVRKGISFDSDPVWQNEMEESFIYEDTPDQRQATEEIKADMETDKPMERLLCGDVGFGKTEVALRAAFKAVTNGWQVAVLVPTTLLAEQHYIVSRERLAQYPINVAMFSRFRSSKQISEDLKKLKSGTIDIAIGTHRLLSKDVHFRRLGLLIVDEEHRFGVRHKEKIRKLKSNVDTLYMSATPIPRTLNMALVKLKEMSLIQSSPKARLPIRTNIIFFDMDIIKDAIRRELDRGGQVLFVHNRVETIESIADQLREALPKVKIAVGHGQMSEKLLERIMLDYYDQKYDVLVATTIIESGIDISNANTIFINRADMFGLAQLYQIRGRVGRSNRRAYAYLIIPRNLTPIARQRLEALSEYNALGSGYQIAMKDLELRGAGSLLGTKQSGVINTIGFNYYNRLLSEAVENLAQGKKHIWDEEKETEKTRIDADFFFPSEYIKDEKTRLKFYNRMIEAENLKQFDEIEEELIDRFGSIPNPAKRGIGYFKLRLLADKCSLETFRIQKNKIIIRFSDKLPPQREVIENLLKRFDYSVDFDGSSSSLRMAFTLPEEYALKKELVLSAAQKILMQLLPEDK